MKTATLVKELSGFTGSARLWHCEPPMVSDCDTELVTEYVVTSATNIPFSGPETYIFASDSVGHVTCWGELPGSFQGGLDHEEAIRNAGYEVR